MIKRGFTFIEVLTPCPTGYNRPNKLGQGLDIMKLYREKSVIQHGLDPEKAELDIKSRIVVGKFIDKEKPSFREVYENMVREKVRKA